MTSSAKIKCAGLATFWAPDHVKDRALDVNVASYCVHPALYGRDVWLLKFKHDEHPS